MLGALRHVARRTRVRSAAWNRPSMHTGRTAFSHTWRTSTAWTHRAPFCSKPASSGPAGDGEEAGGSRVVKKVVVKKKRRVDAPRPGLMDRMWKTERMHYDPEQQQQFNWFSKPLLATYALILAGGGYLALKKKQSMDLDRSFLAHMVTKSDVAVSSHHCDELFHLTADNVELTLGGGGNYDKKKATPMQGPPKRRDVLVMMHRDDCLHCAALWPFYRAAAQALQEVGGCETDVSGVPEQSAQLTKKMTEWMTAEEARKARWAAKQEAAAAAAVSDGGGSPTQDESKSASSTSGQVDPDSVPIPPPSLPLLLAEYNTGSNFAPFFFTNGEDMATPRLMFYPMKRERTTPKYASDLTEGRIAGLMMLVYLYEQAEEPFDLPRALRIMFKKLPECASKAYSDLQAIPQDLSSEIRFLVAGGATDRQSLSKFEVGKMLMMTAMVMRQEFSAEAVAAQREAFQQIQAQREARKERKRQRQLEGSDKKKKRKKKKDKGEGADAEDGLGVVGSAVRSAVRAVKKKVRKREEVRFQRNPKRLAVDAVDPQEMLAMADEIEAMAGDWQRSSVRAYRAVQQAREQNPVHMEAMVEYQRSLLRAYLSYVEVTSRKLSVIRRAVNRRMSASQAGQSPRQVSEVLFGTDTLRKGDEFELAVRQSLLTAEQVQNHAIGMRLMSKSIAQMGRVHIPNARRTLNRLLEEQRQARAHMRARQEQAEATQGQ